MYTRLIYYMKKRDDIYTEKDKLDQIKRNRMKMKKYKKDNKNKDTG